MALLVALAAWLAVRLIVVWLEPSSAWQPTALGASPGAAPAAAGPVAYDFSSNPFSAGDTVADTASVEEPDSDAPETTLNLVLTGIRAVVGDPSRGSAQIRTPDGTEKRFFTRDAVLPNATLSSIRADHVLLSVNGQTQRLTLEDAKRAQAAGPARPRQAALRTLQAPDFTTLSEQVDFQPAIDRDGKRIGVTLRARSSAVDLGDYGLRSGDIATSFGSIRLDQGLPDVAAVQRLAQSGRPVSVQILRDGAPMTITIGGPS